MSMPQIPEEKYRPDVCEVLIDILKSIALEETALANILNAEGRKTS
jgi:ADP-dependent phosphofructokinase/glucokinase